MKRMHKFARYESINLARFEGNSLKVLRTMPTSNRRNYWVTLFFQMDLSVICVLLLMVKCTFADPLVTTTLGQIRGVVKEAENGRNFSAFMGIPYAQPPVGDLRFLPPVDVDSWSDILNATEDGNICPQRDVFGNSSKIIGSEDCLYLNVYTPKLPDDNDDCDLLPVMIWIHGGAWLWWSGTYQHFAPKPLMNKDMVVVGINYRLGQLGILEAGVTVTNRIIIVNTAPTGKSNEEGQLGFLSTEDEVVRGNNGLKDQVAAIRWVKNHISAFGGDPEMITLAGQSAGGASSHYHTLSPLSKDLIAGAILQSGAGFVPWALYYPGEGLASAKTLATAFSCSTDSTSEMVECLREIDAAEIAASDNLAYTWNGQPAVPFKAVVEGNVSGAFLVEHPEYSTRHENQAKIPLMVGNVRHEAALNTSTWVDPTSPDLNAEYLAAFPALFTYDYYFSDDTKNEVSNAILTKFFGSEEISVATVLQLERAITSRGFRRPVIWVAERHYTNNTVYLYQFNYRGNRSFADIVKVDSKNSQLVAHFDDLLYLFNFDTLFGTTDSSDKDALVVETITEMWYNFVANGNPTPEATDLLPTTWQPVTSSKLETFYINGYQNFTMEPCLSTYIDENNFWDSLPIAHSPSYLLFNTTT